MTKIYLTTALIFCLQLVSAQTIRTEDNSMNAGKVAWKTQQINTGKVPFGLPIMREFEVKNVSTENLMILQVKSGGYCTVAEWSKEPIEPGQSTIIKVTYDGLREGEFYRVVMVLTNFDTNQSVPLALTGKVEPNLELSSRN